MYARKKWRGLAGERRQFIHVVVDRPERAVPDILQHLVEPAVFAFAGKERDAHCLRRFQIVRQLRQHGNTAGHVETAGADRQPGGEERAGEIDRARKLV